MTSDTETPALPEGGDGGWTPRLPFLMTGPWENDPEGKNPGIYADDPNGGDPIPLASFKRIYHPDKLREAFLVTRELYEACKAAAAQFRFYEQQHAAKGTDDGQIKGAVNAAFAEHMEAALARARTGAAA